MNFFLKKELALLINKKINIIIIITPEFSWRCKAADSKLGGNFLEGEVGASHS